MTIVGKENLEATDFVYLHYLTFSTITYCFKIKKKIATFQEKKYSTEMMPPIITKEYDILFSLTDVQYTN